jgi:ribosomal protein S8
MNKIQTGFISIFKVYMTQKKIYCYLYNTKLNYQTLKNLWNHNLIWGFVLFNNFLKIYFRYYLNKSYINLINIPNLFLNYSKLKNYNQKYPQSFLLLSTAQGIKSIHFCLKNNIGGQIIFKIN